MKKNLYLMAALIGMGGFVCSSCSDDDETIVEKIVEVQAPMTEANSGEDPLKGSPKLVTEYSGNATVNSTNDKVTPPAQYITWIKTNYNEAGYKTGIEYLANIPSAAEMGPDGLHFTKRGEKNVGTTTITFGPDNRPLKSMKVMKAYSIIAVDANGNTANVSDYITDDVVLADWMYWESQDGGEAVLGAFKELKISEVVEAKDSIVYDAVAKTVTKYSFTMPWGSTELSLQGKYVYKMNEIGLADANNADSYEAIEAAELPAKPGHRKVSNVDAKGNWIESYELSWDYMDPTLRTIDNYAKRDIVYY